MTPDHDRPASSASPGAAAPEASAPAAPALLSPAGLRRAAPMLLLIAGAVIGAILLGDSLSLETLRENRVALAEWREDLGPAAGAIYIAVYAAAVAFSLPGGLVMTLTGGFLFGFPEAAFLTVIGATLGATGIFLAARNGFGERLSARLDASGGSVAKLKKGIAENEISVLLLMRLVPAVPFFVANLLPAFMGVSLRTYVWTTAVGIIPGTAVFSSVGAGLGEVFARGEDPDLGLIFEPHVLGPLLGLCLLAALPAVIKAVRGKPALPAGEGEDA